MGWKSRLVSGWMDESNLAAVLSVCMGCQQADRILRSGGGIEGQATIDLGGPLSMPTRDERP